ncbi:sensor histidine kinase [Desertivirga xinjiangensis]|uniref:sensor histidine kinase n=1 Tax=Desertivirga xinjiangensis TaxID=539206 RepID=UPI00210C6206|nr:PAS domain-containing sensor histidine kinase [Pedobacter xinjiangensis]
MDVKEQKLSLTISDGLLKNLEGMFYKLSSPPQLAMIYVSKVCERMTGYSQEELLTIDFLDIIYPDDRGRILLQFERALGGERINSLEYRIICKDGKLKWVKDISRISYKEQETGDIEGYIIDITTEKNEKTTIKSLKQQHDGLLTELTHKYNELMQFNYIVSHNLRSPIANIIGLTEIIKFHYADEASETGELINFIADSAQSIDTVIQDLNLVLSSRKPMNEKFEMIRLNEIISSVKSNLKKQIKESRATFNIDIPKELDHVRSIKSYLQSIFYNLISNAIKYRKERMDPAISIKADKQDTYLKVQVSDKGLGMDLNSIGDKLFGLYKKFNFDKEGRGLGLHMTKTQIESMGGRIEVISEPDEGSTFTFFLPLLS